MSEIVPIIPPSKIDPLIVRADGGRLLFAARADGSYELDEADIPETVAVFEKFLRATIAGRTWLQDEDISDES